MNTGSAAANYRIEFQGLSARSFDLTAGDWWRTPVTGRPDGTYSVVVKRSNTVVSSTNVTVSCGGPMTVTDREVAVVNACRGGNGYALFQLVNPTTAAKSWVIEFSRGRGRPRCHQRHHNCRTGGANPE